MKRLFAAALGLLLSCAAHAQPVGQLTAGQIWGNPTAALAPATPSSVTSLIDRAISSTQGSVLYRNSTVWTALAPGTNGQVLTSAGAAANPTWTTLAGTGTVTTITAGTGIVLSSGATCTSTCTLGFATIAAGNVLANLSGGGAAPIANTPTAILDNAFGSTRGRVLFRGAANWSGLAAGTAGQVLTTQGGAADPTWTTLTAASNSGIYASSCNVMNQGAVYATLGGTDSTAAIQAAINACGMIYIPGPAGGQTYDARGIPTKCLNTTGNAWTGTLNGGAIGDGPSVSCINVTSASACGFQLQNTFGAVLKDFTIRHTGVTGAGFNTRGTATTPGCGIDAGYFFANDKVWIENVHSMYNFYGVMLGATQASTYLNGMNYYNSGDAVFWATSLNAATLATNFYGLQWNIINPTMFFNTGHALFAQCNTGDIPLQSIYGMRTSFNGGARTPPGTASVAPLLYTIEVDGETASCSLQDFALWNSFLGEGGKGEIWLHSKGTTPYVISNVGLESPGNCNAGQGIGILAANAAITGATNATTPLLIHDVYEFGCGGVSLFGIYVSGANNTTITSSAFQSNAGTGIRLGGNATGGIIMGTVYLAGNVSSDNVTGINVDGGVAALTTSGNRFINNSSSNVTDTGLVLKSNTGDWCGATVLVVVACTW